MSTTKSKYAKSAEQKKIELDETLKRLEQGVRDVFTSENYLEYLRFFAKCTITASTTPFWYCHNFQLQVSVLPIRLGNP